MTPEVCRELWNKASEVEIGIAIEVKPVDVSFLTNLLYATRADMRNPQLDNLILIRPGPKPNELWLMKKTTELPDA